MGSECIIILKKQEGYEVGSFESIKFGKTKYKQYVTLCSCEYLWQAIRVYNSMSSKLSEKLKNN